MLKFTEEDIRRILIATAHVDHGTDKIRKSTLTDSLVAATAHADHGEDKISYLPDELIHHILSFVPITYYMYTSLLSKRWKSLSDSIHTLDFRELLPTTPEKLLKFMKFLDKVLLGFNEKRNIKKFCLNWDYYFDESRVTKWIDIVVQRKVQELFLSGVTSKSFIFPVSFFTCDSLTVLELDSVRLNSPNKVSLRRLKLLQLRNMELGKIGKLLSNCPILEELVLIWCRDLTSEILCISNFALKKLCIRNCNFRKTTVKICTPNLSTVSYAGEVPADFVVHSFPSLVEAIIDMPYTDKTFVLFKLFEKVSNVKLLKIFGDSFLVPREAEILLTNFPAFNNLIHLEVGSDFTYTSFASASGSTLRILFRILEISPYLESVVIETICCTVEKGDDCWLLDPKCSLLHLRSIKFNYFDGKPMEKEAIKFFAKYAKALETMTIVASPRLFRLRNYKSVIKAMRKSILFLTPINCQVIFCN